MKCPYCAHLGDKVVDSRESKEGEVIRRRRECLGCGRRFTTYERVEEMALVVVKSSGERQPFDRTKLLEGLQRACHKRPVATTQLEAAVRDIEAELRNRLRQEVRSSHIGDLALRRLKEIDPVAYVRFASVYRAFADVEEFEEERARLEREPPLPRGQSSLDEHVFATLLRPAGAQPAARLRALRGGRDGAPATPAATTLQEAPDGD